MVKKNIIFLIIISIILIVVGILFYNFNSDKQASYLGEERSEPGVEESKEITSPDEETGIIPRIKNLFTGTGNGGGSGGGSGGSGGSGGGSSGSSGEDSSGGNGVTENVTDQIICQNAQNNNLCNGLDLTYGEGYQTICCSEHNLCC